MARRFSRDDNDDSDGDDDDGDGEAAEGVVAVHRIMWDLIRYRARFKATRIQMDGLLGMIMARFGCLLTPSQQVSMPQSYSDVLKRIKHFLPQYIKVRTN